MRGAQAIVVVAVLMGCTKTAEPPAARVEKPPPALPVRKAAIETDRPRYALREGPFGPETTIVTTFTAPADRTVYLTNCNGAFPMGLQRRVGKDTWGHAWAAEMNACLSEPIVIPPGGRHSGTMTVQPGADAVVSSRRTETKIEGGVYRAVWYGALTSFDFRARPFGEELPLEQRVSAPFVIDPALPADPTRTSPAVRPPEITSVEPAHGSHAVPDAPIRVRFALAAHGLQLNGAAYLYVDRDPVEDVRTAGTDDVPQSELELEYTPPRHWNPGRHEVRVIYQDQQRKTRWFGWSFMVGEEP